MLYETLWELSITWWSPQNRPFVSTHSSNKGNHSRATYGCFFFNFWKKYIVKEREEFNMVIICYCTVFFIVKKWNLRYLCALNESFYRTKWTSKVVGDGFEFIIIVAVIGVTLHKSGSANIISMISYNNEKIRYTKGSARRIPRETNLCCRPQWNNWCGLYLKAKMPSGISTEHRTKNDACVHCPCGMDIVRAHLLQLLNVPFIVAMFLQRTFCCCPQGQRFVSHHYIREWIKQNIMSSCVKNILSYKIYGCKVSL